MKMSWNEIFLSAFSGQLKKAFFFVEFKRPILVSLKSYFLFLFSSSRSELPDRGQDDAAQQSQVHGEWRYRLRSQAPSHV